MENKKKKTRWFTFKIGWNKTPLWVSEGKRAVRDGIIKGLKEKMLDPLVRYSKRKMKELNFDRKSGYSIKIKRIKRYPFSHIQTPGMFYIRMGRKNVLTFRSLELPWKDNARNISCIPKGVYAVKKRYSTKYKKHFHVLDVPGRDYILIHSGNFVKDTEGCILVGDNFTDINNDGYKDVTNSRKTLDKVLEIMPKTFKLIIR